MTAVLEAAGSDWDHVLKVNIFLKHMSDFDAINGVYEKVCYVFWESSYVRADSRVVY